MGICLSHQEEIVDLIRRKYSTEKSRNHGLQWSSGIEQPRGEHSAQPEAGPELIESYFPNLPKIELNRCGPAWPRWSAWGNEVAETI